MMAALPFSLRRSAFTLAACLALAVTLAGCAAQMAFRDGKGLIERGQVEEGLVKLHQALEQDPRNLEYRETYLQARDRALEGFVENAGRLAAAGKTADAARLYRRVLVIDPDNDRGRAGMQAIEAVPRHAKWLEDAQAAWEDKDVHLARHKLQAILAENPRHAGALALKRLIDEKTAPPPPESALSAAYRKPITIEFKNVTLKQVFEVLSRTSGLNFLFDKDVKTDQKTTIFLKDSTVAAAVHFVLLTSQLQEQILDGNTVLIYPDTAAKLKDYQEMVVKTFYLANAEAKTVASTLKGILKVRDIVADEKLNLVIMRDTADAVRQAEKLVALQDVAEPEVMLEVEVLEVKRARLLDLGVQWPDSLSLSPLSSASGGALTLRDLRSNLNSDTIGAGISPLVINAKKTDTDGNILANPRIRARNHEKARIMIGDRVPNITTTATSTGFLSESVNYADVGLKLEVEPTVYLDGEVAIKIGLEVSNIVSQLQTKSGTLAYQIGTRNANTVLRLKDGETQVLAGLINDEDRSTANKVPGLGELPIIGRLFGSTNDDKQKTEIVLSITPHIIRNLQRPEAALSEFRSGTETSFHVRPLSAPIGASASSAAPRPAAASAQAPQPAAANGAGAAAAGTGVDPALGAGSMADPAAGAPPTNAGAAPGVTQLRWQGPAQIKVGDTATVQLMMQASQPITGVPVTVGFDSRALQLVGITEGSFLKQGGAHTDFSSKVAANGQISITAARSGDAGAIGAGTVATLSFRALAPSNAAQVQLLTAAPVGVAARAVAASLPQAFALKVNP